MPNPTDLPPLNSREYFHFLKTKFGPVYLTTTYIIDGAVSSESVIDSILDCRNYLALLRLMIEARQ